MNSAGSNTKGTKITITDLIEVLDENKAVDYIKTNLYGLINGVSLGESVKMQLNNKNVPAPIPKYKQDVVSDPKLKNIYFNLKPAKRIPHIDLLYRGVRIKTLQTFLQRPAEGWINVNYGLILLPDRSDFAGDKNYRLFQEIVRNYIKKNIPDRREGYDKQRDKRLSELLRRLKRIKNNINFTPENLLPTNTKTPDIGSLSSLNDNDISALFLVFIKELFLNGENPLFDFIEISFWDIFPLNGILPKKVFL